MNFLQFSKHRGILLKFFTSQKDNYNSFSALRTTDFLIKNLLAISNVEEIKEILKIIDQENIEYFNKVSLITIILTTYIENSTEDINLIFNLNLPNLLVLGILIEFEQDIKNKINYINIFNLISKNYIGNNLIGQLLINNLKKLDSLNQEEILSKLKLITFNSDSDLKDLKLELLLNLASELNLNILTSIEVMPLFSSLVNKPILYHSFLIYISRSQFQFLVEDLLSYLRKDKLNYSEILQILNVISLILDKKLEVFIVKNKLYELINILNLNSFEKDKIIKIIKFYLNKYKKNKLKKTGIVPAQFMFKGQIDSPGQGNSGGLSTLFLSLGNSLSKFPEIKSVLTFTLTNSYKEIESDIEVNKNHQIIEIPLEGSKLEDQSEIIKYEYILKSYIKNALKLFDLKPDIFQIRYNDNFSKAIIDIAEEKEIKSLLILTPDPHRTIYKYMQEEFLPPQEQLSLIENKLFIADYLLSKSDAITLFPNLKGSSYIKTYFPQLHSSVLKDKPLRIIAEGITLDKKKNISLTPKILDIIYTNNLNQRAYIKKEYSSKPIILNVGRLADIKQQDLLLKAWAETKLYEKYNLVIVGGNKYNYIDEEKEMLNKINLIIKEHKEIEGKFAFLNAISNQQLRRLEAAIKKFVVFKSPNIYICSSFKEEFGISILEAMNANFLLIGPQNGGLSSYIRDDVNGFLVDTSKLELFKKGLNNILNNRNYSSSKLKKISKKGAITVQSLYNIDKIAKDFTKYYINIITNY